MSRSPHQLNHAGGALKVVISPAGLVSIPAVDLAGRAGVVKGVGASHRIHEGLEVREPRSAIRRAAGRVALVDPFAHRVSVRNNLHWRSMLMRNSRKLVVVGSTAALVLAVVLLLAAMGAYAGAGHVRVNGAPAAQRDGGNRDDDGEAAFFAASLAPSLPTDPALHGVAAGGAPWVLRHGSVRISADGHIRATIQGLVIPVAHGTFPAGTARPVTVVSAALYCAPDASAAVATTAAVPISAAGDARIADTLTLPPTCLAPIVLVHPNQAAGVYIALSGLRG